jgi:hypothetical protein
MLWNLYFVSLLFHLINPRLDFLMALPILEPACSCFRPPLRLVYIMSYIRPWFSIRPNVDVHLDIAQPPQSPSILCLSSHFLSVFHSLTLLFTVISFAVEQRSSKWSWNHKANKFGIGNKTGMISFSFRYRYERISKEVVVVCSSIIRWFARRGLKYMNNLRLAESPAEIGTKHLINASLGNYHYTNVFGYDFI